MAEPRKRRGTFIVFRKFGEGGLKFGLMDRSVAACYGLCTGLVIKVQEEQE